MTDKKIETKKPELEREYTIPLRSKTRRAVRYKKTNKAITAIKQFLVRHMKIRDRDLKKIKIDKYLNEAVWFRGIRHPPARIKVKAIKEGGIVRVELADMPDKLKFKKLREEKIDSRALETGKKKKTIENPAEKLKTDEEKKEIEGDKTEEKEKKAAVIESGKMIEKAAAKKFKHVVGGKTKQPKHQIRQALDK